ncbi:MAG TPA: DUF1501 domain-containing protein [Tepidisphaeraceae bacterium]|nr:DUF1501 domain-containing protein [Tepidisphaeraceae bacterium]
MNPTPRYCDHVSRRDILRVGAIASLGLTLPNYLRLVHADALNPKAKAKSAIFVFLGGGPPHLDTFDMKPDAPAEIRGEFNPIATNVPGVRICEHLPNLAKCADKYAVINGISHTLAGHELGTEYLNTGNRPIPSLIYPGLGAVVTKELPGAPDLPPYVAVPSTPQKAGYLGVRHAPLQTAAVPKPGEPFNVRGISLANGLTVADFERRQKLLADLDTTFRGAEKDSKLLDGLDRFAQQAYDMISSQRAREAFDTSREKPETAEKFGPGNFGQSCLLATRLVEAGVRFVTVTFGGWDTHSGNFKNCKEKLLPQLDQGLAALFTTLAERGLLDSTAVYVTGEFGRTPKINDKAGRDHWPRAMFSLLAGAGMKGGQIIGASDKHGMGPDAQAIAPDQVAASFFHALGIDHKKEYHTPTGRPVMLVREGSVLPGLF